MGNENDAGRSATMEFSDFYREKDARESLRERGISDVALSVMDDSMCEDALKTLEEAEEVTPVEP